MKTNENTNPCDPVFKKLSKREQDAVMAAELRMLGEDEEADEIEARWEYEINTSYIP